MWGIDTTARFTLRDGHVTLVAMIDQHSVECFGKRQGAAEAGPETGRGGKGRWSARGRAGAVQELPSQAMPASFCVLRGGSIREAMPGQE